jgi:curved DNA-binding protein CbpA
MAPAEVTDDYYAILEVHHTATVNHIKKSYRRLAILYHPDKNQNKPDATASFQLVSVSSTNNFLEAVHD